MEEVRGLKVGDMVMSTDGRKGVIVEGYFMNSMGIVGVDFTGAGMLNRAETRNVKELKLLYTKEYIDDLADIIDPHPSTILREWLDSLKTKK